MTMQTAKLLDPQAAPQVPLPAELLAAQFAALCASSIDAIVSVDSDDAVTSWSPAAERLFGYPAAEVIGRKLSDFDGAPDRLAERRQYLQRLHDGEPIEYQTIRHRKDGEPIEIWVRGAPMKAPDGRMVGACLIVRDITAQKQRDPACPFPDAGIDASVEKSSRRHSSHGAPVLEPFEFAGRIRDALQRTSRGPCRLA